MLTQHECTGLVAQEVLPAYIPEAHVEVALEDHADSVLLAQYIPLLLH